MQHSTPAAPAVRETLERMLASQTFGRSERARNLLRYLVEREQAGDAERLKGFSIAMDVFGKDADFDSANDAVVRVQAGRLRDLLQQYFDTEGADEPLRITIPRGGYIPAYEMRSEQHERTAPAEIILPADSRPRPDSLLAAELPELAPSAPLPAGNPSILRHLQFFWLAIGVVIAMLGLLILRQGDIMVAGDVGFAGAAKGPAITTASIPVSEAEILPIVYLGTRAAGADAGLVASALRAGLTGFDTIDFIGRDFTGAPDASRDATSFAFEVLRGPAGRDVTIELQNIATGRVLLSRNLTAQEIENGLEDRIAGILSATIPASGTIYGYIEQAGIQTGLTKCLLLNDDYYLDQNAATHEAAYRCFEELVRQDTKSPLAYSEMSALHMEAATDRYAYPPGASLEKALALAHKAVQMGATSPYAHRAYGYVNSRLGNSEESIRWMRKAYELNTYDLSMAAAYGYGMIFAAHYVDGTPIIARAVEASSAHPPWWDFGLFLGEFMIGDIAKAERATVALTTTDAKSHYLAARLIIAKAKGDEKARMELINELNTTFPRFVADPRKVFVEREYPADLTKKLVDALRNAGLGAAS